MGLPTQAFTTPVRAPGLETSKGVGDMALLDKDQILSAVCGHSNATGGVGTCPATVIDLVMDFPSRQSPNASLILSYFAGKFDATDKIKVEVMSILRGSERPFTTTSILI